MFVLCTVPVSSNFQVEPQAEAKREKPGSEPVYSCISAHPPIIIYLLTIVLGFSLWTSLLPHRSIEKSVELECDARIIDMPFTFLFKLIN